MRRSCLLATAWLALAASPAIAADCLPDGDSHWPRVPGRKPPVETPRARCDPTRSLPPSLDQDQRLPAVPDRWRIVDSLPGYELEPWNPYARNRLKGDLPLHDDWFLAIGAISDTVLEPRRVPVATGDVEYEERSEVLLTQNLSLELRYFEGGTVFRPPDIEFRFTPVLNMRGFPVERAGSADINPDAGETRTAVQLGVQSAFVDYQLRTVSDHFDIDRLRIGIQPFTADFRGFLLQDAPFGVRLYGTRDNNRDQYNLAWLHRLDKDPGSGLNALEEGWLEDDVLVGNWYRQDFARPGLTAQATVLFNRNRDAGVFTEAGAAQPRADSRGYDVWYPGLSADGHLGRWNLSASVYAALGESSSSAFAAGHTDIRAGFGAAELGFDQDWVRWRLSLLFASGDDNPFDGTETGFSTIFENPLLGGADTGYWSRQALPLRGAGPGLTRRNALLPELRDGDGYGASNFSNPGLVLAGIGADLDLTPRTRLSLNANHLGFVDTASLEALRDATPIGRRIGWDISAALVIRPLAIQNVVLRVSGAVLVPGAGYEALYGDGIAYSLLCNLVLSF